MILTSITHSTRKYGQDPLSIADMRRGEESSEYEKTDNFIKKKTKATIFAKLAIEQANVRNADNANNTQKEEEFQVGDQVMLSTKNLALKPGRINKLSRTDPRL